MSKQQEWLKLAQDDDGSFYLRPIGNYPTLNLAKSNHPGAIVVKAGLGEDLDALLHLLITGRPGLMCKFEPRTFHRRITIYEALSEEPFDNTRFDEVIEECRMGHMSGSILREIDSTMDGAHAAEALEGQGSDPAFFGLDAAGNEVDQ